MIDEINISFKGGMTSTCRSCQKEIDGVEVRGCQEGFGYTNYFCKKCTEKQIAEMDKNVKKIKQDYETLSKMTRKEREQWLLKLKVLKNLK